MGKYANPQRARQNPGWEPRKSFSALIQEMVEHDLRSNYD